MALSKHGARCAAVGTGGTTYTAPTVHHLSTLLTGRYRPKASPHGLAMNLTSENTIHDNLSHPHLRFRSRHLPLR